MSIKKIIHLVLCLFLLVLKSQAQTTYDFSTNAVLSGMNHSWPWNTTANITIGGVDYIITGGINGSYTNSADGGSLNSKSLRKDGSGGDSFTLKRVDNQPFQFYGIWISHQSMNSYSTGPNAVILPPWYTLSTTGTDSFLYQDMTTMTPGTNWDNYTSSSIPISAGAGGKKVTSVTVNFQAIIFYSIDDIIVGPAASANPVITGNPPNRTICSNGNTTFSITATGATSYQWYQNTGNGFVALSNGAPFSGVTTSTLAITGATGAMNGYQYRCVATNSSGSTTSNSANLTVVSVTATTAKTNVSCNGGNNGTATVTASGGIGPYTYSWSPSGGTGATATGLGVGVYTVTVTDNLGCFTTATATITQPTAISGTTVVTNIACNGGSTGVINLTPTGGATPYTFNWGGGITTEDRTGLAAGTYTVTITDANGCTGTVSATVTQPTAMSATTSQTNISCNGGTNGTASIVVTGGTAPYTYSWSPSGGTAATATGLSAGTYTVTVTNANACTITRTVTITQPTAISGTTVVTNIACNGGSTGAINLTPTGGSAPYTFNWGGGITTEDRTGLAAGTYTVTITDANGCTGTVNATVTQPTAMSATTSQTNISCNGGTNGTASIVVTGGTAPYTYSWSPSGGTAATATGLLAGTYTVTVTNANACTITRTVTITQPTAISGTTVVTNIACNGGSTGAINLTPTGGSAPYTFNWGGGITTEDRTGLAAGTYTVIITDANGCTRTVSATVTQPTAMSATTSQTNISCNGGTNGTASIVVTGGTAPYTYSWSPSGGTAATATGLSAGTYTVTVTDANACTITRTVTITQPTAISGTTVVTSIACNGGSTGAVNLTPTGGSAPYTFNWGGGITTEDRTGLAAGTYTVIITDANGCTRTVSATVTQPTAMSATTSQTNISCNGGTNGTASIVVTGGTAPYTYSWSPSGGTAATATGLSAGTYTVTVTDANACTITRTVTITQPTAISGTTVVTNIACNGGSTGAINLTPTGGSAPYTFNWGGGITTEDRTGLAAGTYTVIITDANGCTRTVSATVTQPTTMSATTSQINISCNGGSNGTASIIVTGGTAPYTYSWSPSGGTAATATGLSAGTYTVTVTDANACTITRTVTITQPTAMSATTSQTNISCNGGTNGTAGIVITGGTAPYTYSWSPSGGTAATATGLSAGTYTVTVTDGNACTITRTVTITQPTAMSATVSQTNISCNGGSNGTAGIVVTGGTAPYTYSWSPSGGTAATASGLSAGTYTVTVTDANACTITRTVTITQPTAMSATVSQTNISCNGGTNGTAGIVVTGGTAPYTYSWSPSGGTAATATGLSAGTYTVTVTDGNACTITKSVTITQPTALTATTSQVNVSCNSGSNGSASLTVSGGTAPYTYSWSPSGGTAATASGLAAGTYTVTVTDGNLCTITKTFTITQPTALTASAVQNFPASCLESTDANATVTVTGGTTPYTYLWDNGMMTANVDNLSVGTHTVTVTDFNGCTATTAVTITFEDTVSPLPTLVRLPDVLAQCLVNEGDVAVPTATDNCLGTVMVTNNAVFPITTQGTTVITWTYEDVNGNTTTQQQTIVVDDVTAPVPTIASLPVITRECAVTTADIPVPTANDNCVGIITATTTDALVYTEQGTYTINWTYNDGNGNITMQQQTVIVEESPLADIVLNDITTVYDGTVHNLMVDNMPAGAAVSYSITPLAEEDNGAVNAGVYTVTAVVTPPVSAVNCEAVTLTAELVIEKAMQTIVFDELEVLLLEEAEDFQLSAVASSGLPVDYTYTYNQSTPAATVAPQGWVEIMHSGSVLITAHQQGNSNYLPAASVDRSLVINSKDASIQQIVINGQVYTNPDETVYYTLDCDDVSNEVVVQIDAEFGAAVSPARDFVIGVPKPGVYRQTIEVISENGASVQRYQIIVERPFAFEDIVVQKFDNTLLINNNPQTNGGYRFVKYEWYRNDVLIGTEQVYSAGNSKQDILDENALYRAVLTTENGDVIHTCAARITRKNNFKINVYPNPVRVNEQLEVVFDYPSSAFKGATAALYTTSGKLVQSVKLNENVSSVKLPAGISEGIYMLVLQIEGRQETIKVVVKQ